MCDCKTFPGSRRLVLNYLDDLSNHFCHFLGSKLADLVKHDMAIRGKQTVRSYIAALFEAAALKILILQRDCIVVSDALAGYLAKQEIVPL
jgi:hypothetical protein